MRLARPVPRVGVAAPRRVLEDRQAVARDAAPPVLAVAAQQRHVDDRDHADHGQPGEDRDERRLKARPYPPCRCRDRAADRPRARAGRAAARARSSASPAPPGGGKSTLAARDRRGARRRRRGSCRWTASTSRRPSSCGSGRARPHGRAATRSTPPATSRCCARLRGATRRSSTRPRSGARSRSRSPARSRSRREVPLVVTEGNYLLVDDGPWAESAPLLDEAWYVEMDEETAARAADRAPHRVRQDARRGRARGSCAPTSATPSSSRGTARPRRPRRPPRLVHECHLDRGMRGRADFVVQAAIMPAATVSFVASSTRMNAPVAWLRGVGRRPASCRRARSAHAADVVQRELVGGRAARASRSRAGRRSRRVAPAPSRVPCFSASGAPAAQRRARPSQQTVGLELARQRAARPRRRRSARRARGRPRPRARTDTDSGAATASAAARRRRDRGDARARRREGSTTTSSPGRSAPRGEPAGGPARAVLAAQHELHRQPQRRAPAGGSTDVSRRSSSGGPAYQGSRSRALDDVVAVQRADRDERRPSRRPIFGAKQSNVAHDRGRSAPPTSRRGPSC